MAFQFFALDIPMGASYQSEYSAAAAAVAEVAAIQFFMGHQETLAAAVPEVVEAAGQVQPFIMREVTKCHSDHSQLSFQVRR